MAQVEVHGVHAGYGAAEILHDIHMQVAPQEIVTIIGPNGAGKSTLLKTIMGYLIPKKGVVRIDGADITRMRPDQRVRAGVAYVPQLDNVFPSLTVRENLIMGGFTLDAATTRARMEALLAEFPRLAERQEQRVRTMSGGERQMLAMARALMTDPRLLLLDEPSAALSPRLVQQVFDTVTRINEEQGRTIIIVEQEARVALEASHRGYVLADGRNVMDDRADRVLHDPRIREAYLGGTEEAEASA